VHLNQRARIILTPITLSFLGLTVVLAVTVLIRESVRVSADATCFCGVDGRSCGYEVVVSDSEHFFWKRVFVHKLFDAGFQLFQHFEHMF
jgi:hypothetical protein